MTGYALVKLREMLGQIGEDRTKAILLNFMCPYNKDVDEFLKYKAIEFCKQGISVTYLVFAPYKGKSVLIGYFTLANKIIIVGKKGLSKTLRRRIAKFAQYDYDLKAHLLSAPLIGQLSKNFRNGYNSLITGDELLKLACDKVQAIQGDIGGKVVYLECEDKPKLVEFYSENGFVRFGDRPLDKDEVGLHHGKYLVQMLKYLR